MLRNITAILLMQLSLTPGACDRDKNPAPPSRPLPASDRLSTNPTPAPTTPTTPTTPREGAARDAYITDKLHESLAADRAISEQARRIGVTTNNGIVTLKGQVPNQSDRDIIHAKAVAIPEVIRVEDKIEVVTVPTPAP